MKKILPVVEINYTGNSITITSHRLATARSLPFDVTGKCRECRGTDAETEWCITKEGVRVWCSRFKTNPRFVPFDFVYDMPGHTFFKIKNRGRVFNVDHGYTPEPRLPTPRYSLNILPTPNPPPVPPKPKAPVPAAEVKTAVSSEPNAEATEFFDALSAATVFMDSSAPPPEKRQKTAPTQADATEFFDSLSAATTFMDTSLASAEKPVVQTIQPESSGLFEAISSAASFVGGVKDEQQQVQSVPTVDDPKRKAPPTPPVAKETVISEEELLDEFFASISAASHGLTTAGNSQKAEEDAAIANLKKSMQ